MNTKNMIYADGKRAILYLRVSTEEQVDNFSLETQEEICRKEAEKRGFEIVEIFKEEGRSAKNIIGRPVIIVLLDSWGKKTRIGDANRIKKWMEKAAERQRQLTKRS